ncbi:hypothetical protein FDB88_05780 [Clostridium sporogenes]|uniref:hypothetical protein n=1 Tax=Clostridium sporogenes TaxID=1509 RepID=UPI0013D5F8F6|nr:hypothetical protein [Clostridium sporogenes]NFM16719.1 hypothetical protein [Clostridium sporogenes]
MKSSRIIKVIKLNSKQNNNCVKIKLHVNTDNEKSILYAMGKKRENNPKKLATITYPNGDIIKVLITNNFIVKNIFNDYIINTSKEEINSDLIKFKQIKKIFLSNNYSIISQPQLEIKINGLNGIPVDAECFYNIPYTEDSIKKFINQILAFHSSNKYYKIL